MAFRFTADVQDVSNHLSAANRYETNMPLPYFDRDFAGARCYEAEITTESLSFPSSTTATYHAGLFFTHWWYDGMVSKWIWDPNGGNLSFSEQLSMQIFGADDKWNTASPVYGGNAIAQLGVIAYPSKPKPSTSPPLSAEPCNWDGGPLSVDEMPADATLTSFSVAVTGDEPGEVVVHPDLSGGLPAYANRAHALARALAAHGPVSATVTFMAPLGESDITALAQTGTEVRSVEAVTRQDTQGLHWTFGGAYRPETFQFFDSASADHDLQLLGITSAQIIVPDVATLNRILRLGTVYVLDASAEQVARADHSVRDVQLNDLYWELAGWTQ
jgi:hypothetical protein